MSKGGYFFLGALAGGVSYLAVVFILNQWDLRSPPAAPEAPEDPGVQEDSHDE